MSVPEDDELAFESLLDDVVDDDNSIPDNESAVDEEVGSELEVLVGEDDSALDDEP